MAYVEQDSELFTNVISATAIPAGRAFTAFKDVDGSPAIFSLGSNDTGLPDTLNLFVQTAGKLVNFDFGRACGVTDRVTAFGVRQRSDSSLFIVFSVEKNGRNEILVLPNLQVKDIASPVHGTIITSDMKLPEIHGIYLVSLNAWYLSVMLIEFRATTATANLWDEVIRTLFSLFSLLIESLRTLTVGSFHTPVPQADLPLSASLQNGACQSTQLQSLI